MYRLALCVLLSGLLSACATTPFRPIQCAIPLRPLETSHPRSEREAPMEETAKEQSFEGMLADRLVKSGQANFAGDADPREHWLFLSGGSQRGSFGAGFLEGWAKDKATAPPPDFDVVTGVSAGAILSTAAFVGDWEEPARFFRGIERESQVLTPYVKMRDGEMTDMSIPALVRENALGNLMPMRGLLLKYLREQRALERVAIKARAGKLLLVGAVDLSSGKAVAFDLTALADEFVRTGNEHLRECYADAVLASSSVPMATKPVFLNNRLYIDGGARFGVFQEGLLATLMSKALAPRAAALRLTPPHIYIIVNGTQETDPDCEDREAVCDLIRDPTANVPVPHPKWSLKTVAARSVSILINQVYRFSVDTIRQANLLAFPEDKGRNFHFARIEADVADHVFGEKKCPEWYIEDRDTLRPVEFYPNYMDCLVDYGSKKGDDADWELLSPLPT